MVIVYVFGVLVLGVITPVVVFRVNPAGVEEYTGMVDAQVPVPAEVIVNIGE